MSLARAALLVALGSLPSSGSKGDAADETAKDLALLQGTWRVISWEKNGVLLEDDQLPALRPVTFSGGTFRWEGDPTSGTVTLDASTRPRRVDYTNGLDDGTQSVAYAGIYRVTEDTFRDCFAEPGKSRPTRFGTRRGDGVQCVAYRRDSDLQSRR